MVQYSKEIGLLEAYGYMVLYIGLSRPLCPKCGKRAITYNTNNMVCDKKHNGCAASFRFDKDLRNLEKTRLPMWRVGKPIDGIDTYIYIAAEILERLPKLTKEQIDDWYFAWDDGAQIYTLAKADLPDELSKIENSVLLKPESAKKAERVGRIRI